MNYKLYLLLKRMNKIWYILICMIGVDHVKWLKKHKIFYEIGEQCFYQPNKLPNEPKLIKLHNNIKIAANVTFYTHDVINAVFANMDNTPYQTHAGCVEIFDNVFIGGGSIIIGPVSIGPNAIIAAGSVVVKNVPEGSIVGGNPARIIGRFADIKTNRETADKGKTSFDPEEINRRTQLWSDFIKENKSNVRK